MSAVVQEKQVETIFDYELTDEERETLTFGMSESQYLATSNYEGNIMGLVTLFAMRGDKKNKDYYLSKLPKETVISQHWDVVQEATSH